jgi:hypothetical protein
MIFNLPYKVGFLTHFCFVLFYGKSKGKGKGKGKSKSIYQDNLRKRRRERVGSETFSSL